MRIRLDEIKCPVNHTSKDFYGAVQTALLKTSEGLKILNEKFGWSINMADSDSIMINSTNVRILKKSLDARKKPQLFFIFSVEVFWDEPLEFELCNSLFRVNSFPGNTGASENCDFQKNTNVSSENCDFPQKANISNEFNGIEQTKDMTTTKPCPIVVGICNVCETQGIKKENTTRSQYRPIVVGSGPAGLFAALTLAANGLKPILIERGKDVDARIQDINEFWDKGVLLPESNVQFGEGGAGTFSDGKLTTGIKDPACRAVLETFVDAGAPIEILSMSKPHIGTDLLRDIVKKIRRQIEFLGGTVLFETKLTGIQVVDGRINAINIESKNNPNILNQMVLSEEKNIVISNEIDLVVSEKKDVALSDKKDTVLSDEKDMDLSDKKDMGLLEEMDISLSEKNEFSQIKPDGSLLRNETASSADITNPIAFSFNANSLIIAIGHSARDTIRMLNNSGLEMHAKPFSMGVRIEHNQKTINESQYGKQTQDVESLLPAAEYKLSCHLPDGRDVYTFCMCPGGQVIASASGEGQVVTNGMSLYSRAQENANSAVLVNVNPSDFGGDSPLSGIDFQEKWENKAYIAGGSCYKAPAQYVGDFISNTNNSSGNNLEIPLVVPTYTPGVTWTNLAYCLPAFVTESILSALPIFERKLAGFASPGAVMTGIESRSSSPVRIIRNAEKMANIEGIFPCGEGAGYAGGIMSAAVDGIACAKACIENNNM